MNHYYNRIWIDEYDLLNVSKSWVVALKNSIERMVSSESIVFVMCNAIFT